MSINQYTYCYNNPLLYVDPTGHWADQASLQEMYESGEIDNYHITYVPGVGETITVTQGGATLNITDNNTNEYFDYTERVHDLMGFGNTRPADKGSSDPGSSGGSSVYSDNLAANAKPSTAKEEVKRVVIKAAQLDIHNQGYYGSSISLAELNRNTYYDQVYDLGYYIDFNITIGAFGGVFTMGILYDKDTKNVHQYIGGGGGTAGIGVAVTRSRQGENVSEGWNTQAMGSMGYTYGGGFDSKMNQFNEQGIGTPGFSLTRIYVFQPEIFTIDRFTLID